MFANILAKPLSEVINSNLAPNTSFLCGKVTTHFPVDNKADKKCRIFWPLSLLNCFSKIYENILKGRHFSTIEPFLPTYVSAYRKHYKAQHVLLRLLEEWREKLDNNFFAGYVLMDLSKTFDYVLQNLLLAKLAACGFDMNFLCYIYSYLPPLKKNVWINNTTTAFDNVLSAARINR